MSVTTWMGRIDSPTRCPHGRRAAAAKQKAGALVDDLDVMADKDQLVGAGPCSGYRAYNQQPDRLEGKIFRKGIYEGRNERH